MAELCMSCAHKKVCMKDKNLVGDVFVPGNPMFFDNKELFKKYEERKKAGFPCDDYLSADVVPVVRCKDCVYYDTGGFPDGLGWCEVATINTVTHDNFFCAEGKKKGSA